MSSIKLQGNKGVASSRTARAGLLCAVAGCLSAGALVEPATAQMAPATAQPAQPAGDDAGVWLTFKGDLQRTGSSTARLNLPLNLMWRHTVDVNDFPDPTPGSPLVAGPPGARRAYFTSGSQVFCVDAETGSKVWASADEGSTLRAPLTLIGGDDGDTLLAVGESGIISALRTSDGVSTHRADTQSQVQAAPVLVKTAKGDRIIVATSTGRLLAYTRDLTPDPSWQVRLGRESATPTSSPALNARGDRLYITGNDQNVHCVDVKTGKLLYSAPVGGQANTTPLLLGDSVIVSASQSLVALRQSKGLPQWQVKLDDQIASSPAGQAGAAAQNGAPAQNGAAQGTAYVGTRAGSFYAINTANGAVRWKVNLAETAITGTPLVLPGIVLVGTDNGLLYGFKPETGAIIWTYRLHTERDVPVRARSTNTGSNRRNTNGGNTRGGNGGNTRGGNGGGNGRNNGNGNNAGNTSGATTIEQRIFGVSSAPAVAGDQVFLLGDNQALYSFSAVGFDSDVPRFVQPTVSVTSEQDTLYSRLVDKGRPFSIPGRAPVYFTAEIDDAGSGVDPESIRVTRNGTPVARADYDFSPATGVLTVVLAEVKADGTSTSLADGPLNLNITVRDYKGNSNSYPVTIAVDNLTPPPSDPAVVAPGGAFPGGGFPGGNFPNGVPNGFPGGIPNGFPQNQNGMLNGFPTKRNPGNAGQDED